MFIQREDHIHASYQTSWYYFCLKEPLHTAPPLVPSSTHTNPILQYYPDTPHVPPRPVSPSLISVTVTPHCSNCKTKGIFTSKRFQDEIYSPHGAQAFPSTLTVTTQYDTDSQLDYLVGLNTYYDKGTINCSDPRAFVSIIQPKFDPENPSYS